MLTNRCAINFPKFHLRRNLIVLVCFFFIPVIQSSGQVRDFELNTKKIKWLSSEGYDAQLVKIRQGGPIKADLFVFEGSSRSTLGPGDLFRVGSKCGDLEKGNLNFILKAIYSGKYAGKKINVPEFRLAILIYNKDGSSEAIYYSYPGSDGLSIALFRSGFVSVGQSTVDDLIRFAANQGCAENYLIENN